MAEDTRAALARRDLLERRVIDEHLCLVRAQEERLTRNADRPGSVAFLVVREIGDGDPQGLPSLLETLGDDADPRILPDLERPVNLDS